MPEILDPASTSGPVEVQAWPAVSLMLVIVAEGSEAKIATSRLPALGT